LDLLERLERTKRKEIFMSRFEDDEEEDVYALKRRIEDLESEIISIKNLLRFHRLDSVPIKYRKAYPKKGEYPYFESPDFREQTPPFYDLSDFSKSEGFKIILPHDLKEYQNAKLRMADYQEGKHAIFKKERDDEAKRNQEAIQRFLEECPSASSIQDDSPQNQT
jgi:hypothetical protein